MKYLRLLAVCIALAALSCLLAVKPAKAQAAAQPQPNAYLLARPAWTPLRPWLYGRVWVTPPAYYAVPLTPVVPVVPYPN